MPTFDLIDCPWLPCLMDNGEQRDLSLRDALQQASVIRELCDLSPPVTMSLHRLLIAVLHRCIEIESAAAWDGLYRSKSFGMERVGNYLDTWRDRFDLFHPQHPFFQTLNVEQHRAGSVARLMFQTDDSPTLFDHTSPRLPRTLTPAQAARYVVRLHAFDMGGMISGTSEEKFTTGAPLIQAATMLVRGANLFETLVLNLHQYQPEDGQPWEFERLRDKPAWERFEETAPVARQPDGYLDFLTWQSRRILLLPESEGDDVAVRRAVVMKGYQLPKGYLRFGRETMIAFRRDRNAKVGQDPWPAITFREERALWRDSYAYMHSVAEERARPKMADWLADLCQRGYLDRKSRIPLDLLGFAADQASPQFWRHERLNMPLRFLDDEDLFSGLRRALEIAESVGLLLANREFTVRRNGKAVKEASPLRHVAEALVGARGPVDDFVKHLGGERSYWADLEEPFHTFVATLPDDLQPDGNIGGRALIAWAEAVNKAVLAAFAAATAGLAAGTRGIRAIAEAESDLRARLGIILLPVMRRSEPVQIGETANG